MSITRHHCRKCAQETLHRKCVCIHCGTSMFDTPAEPPQSKKLFGTFGLKKPTNRKRA